MEFPEPTPADFNRKRALSGPSQSSKSPKKAKTGRITAYDRVKDNPNEYLEALSANELFCNACKHPVKLLSFWFLCELKESTFPSAG